MIHEPWWTPRYALGNPFGRKVYLEGDASLLPIVCIGNDVNRKHKKPFMKFHKACGPWVSIEYNPLYYSLSRSLYPHLAIQLWYGTKCKQMEWDTFSS